MTEKFNFKILEDFLKNLTNHQLDIILNIAKIFQSKLSKKFINKASEFINEKIYSDFGDLLKVHHIFSIEPFTKDKFEFGLQKVFSLNGYKSELANKGNRGHDLTLDSIKISLKTQADSKIKSDEIHISKFMELGKGEWKESISDLKNLHEQFINHLENYDKILMLRFLRDDDSILNYELIEIPKSILLKSQDGIFSIMSESKQFPKPGYCEVYEGKDLIYKLYFDGGSERKLQIKNLNKNYCIVHAEWGISASSFK
ncbi:hypothetical protein [Leptospira vanthielii]|uniref:Restriction endonuclease n=1 Tax=Leptospira vanthielii serovar Holland str. Waz Holland = ATCC 700522 TaxID=1218591 RepID=N1W3G8_9LEPT|nr:hypothetical protein [Leptospira vanthielii]EMY67772.1 hypothetical protein LEP1GSC199_0651 [Leptospira vanthielii serovar Holland str. Waz Holland = ATCC 700522]